LGARARAALEHGAPKGDALAAARIAGILGAKRTPELIPLCHTVALTHVSIDLELEDSGVRLLATAASRDRTGVEMEALTAVTIAALTLIDMLKAVERELVIEQVQLEEKHGGKGGAYVRGGGA
jgi:cyclic pyranopterin phosphate synthase